jgi:hydroxymethylpyrimidine pyrophosphatase-like HAD family hydrolase
MSKKTICIDFDGTIAEYDPEKYEDDKFGEPINGVQNALTTLRKNGYKIIIFTTRKNSEKFKKYLEENEIPYDYINENPDQPEYSNAGKPIADLYVDDRAITFRGDWKRCIEDIAYFREPKKKDEQKSFDDAFKNYKKMAENSAKYIG